LRIMIQHKPWCLLTTANNKNEPWGLWFIVSL
jgi:hypothetical protein